MNGYRTIVVGTDGSSLAEPTVARAACIAKNDDSDLVIVCAYSQLSRRDEAKNVATLGDSRVGQVLGREAAGLALSTAMALASTEGATVTAALLLDAEPATALVATADERGAELIVLGGVPGRSLADRLLGSTALAVTKRARCDVLIVRPPLERDTLDTPDDADPSV